MAQSIPKTFMFAFLLLHLALLAVGQGTQFITGPCTSDADCASSCCGFHSGKCAGPVIAQERDGGCGFGNAQPNNIAALAFLGKVSSSAISSNTATVAAQATASLTTNTTAITATASAGSTISAGKQFITGPCTSDTDCADGCCGFNTGKCAGPIIAQEIDGGCGFGDAQPNDNAARALRGGQRRRRMTYRA